MPEDYMPQEGEMKSPAEDRGEGGEEETFLAPAGIFPKDCKPGDKYMVEVVHAYEDEKELKLMPHKKRMGMGKEMEMDDSEMKDPFENMT